MNLKLMFILGVICMAGLQHVDAQYFSTSDGATLSRIGKRNFIYKALLHRSKPSTADDINEASATPGDYYLYNKPSAFKIYSRAGKRGQNMYDLVMEKDASSSASDQILFKNLIEQMVSEYNDNYNENLSLE